VCGEAFERLRAVPGRTSTPRSRVTPRTRATCPLPSVPTAVSTGSISPATRSFV